MNKLFVNRMEGIILPRLAAGFDPIPSHFKPHALISPRDNDGDFSMTRAYLSDYLKKGGGDVAVIPVNGAMSRNGFCGMGNEFLIDVLAEAAAEKQVKAVVINANTPGGTVDSIEILADAIKWFPKPIVGYVNGSVDSAGVFMMTQTDYTVMENSMTSRYGCIGVIMVHVDQSQALKNAGLNVRIFRSGEAVDKAVINGIEPLTPALEAQIQKDLDEGHILFKGYVKRGRAGKLNSEDVFTGISYNKTDAVNYGLVDRTGSLADAISIARKM